MLLGDCKAPGTFLAGLACLFQRVQSHSSRFRQSHQLNSSTPTISQLFLYWLVFVFLELPALPSSQDRAFQKALSQPYSLA